MSAFTQLITDDMIS